MDLQVFDMDQLKKYHVDETGLHECDSPYCSDAHLFSLYDGGVFLGHDIKDIAVSTLGENTIIKENK
jgi:hypothetical protein